MRNDKSSVWVFCFFFKQKTAYEMRISDWSSDVCSSDLFERGFVEAVQHQHLRPAEQRGVEREAGVFGRGADEHDRAALDEGQEAVLLRTIEAVYLIDEQQGALARRRHLLGIRSEEHTSELQSLMRISYAVFCLKKKNISNNMNI